MGKSQKKKQKLARKPPHLHTSDVANCAYGITAEEISRRCGVDVATARRWKSGRSRIPYAAAALLLGELGVFSSAWRGWRLETDEIISPDGWRVSRNDALAVPLLHGQIAALRAEILKLKEQLEMPEQPMPGAIPKIKA